MMLADTVEAWAHAYEAKDKDQGKAEGEMLLLQKLLNNRFGAIPASITAQIAGASLQDIERWFDLAIDANRLSEIFEEIEHYFAEFIAFYFPEAYAQIDWSRTRAR